MYGFKERIQKQNVKKLIEGKESVYNYLWTGGEFTNIRDYDQTFYLKKILKGQTFDKLYRFLNTNFKYATYAVDKEDPLNVKNWKEGQEVLFPLTSTTPDKNLEDKIRKDLGFKKINYCLIFQNVKGYAINYDDIKGIETPNGLFEPHYLQQAEVLIAGMFKINKIYTEGEGFKKKTVVELETLSQDKEVMKEILKNSLTKNQDHLNDWRALHKDGSHSQKFSDYEDLKQDIYTFQIDSDKERELKRLQRLYPSSIKDFMSKATKLVSRIFYNSSLFEDYYLYGCKKVIPNFEESLDVKYLYEYENQIWNYLINIKEDELKDFLDSENVSTEDGNDWSIYNSEGKINYCEYGQYKGNFYFVGEFKDYYQSKIYPKFDYFLKIKDQINNLLQSDSGSLHESQIYQRLNIKKLIEQVDRLEEGNKLKVTALLGLLLLGGLDKAEAKDAIQNKDTQTIENIKDTIKSINATEFDNLVKQMVVSAYGKEGLKNKANVIQAEVIARQNLKKDGIEITYYKDNFKEDIEDWAYRFAKRKHDDTGAIRRYSGNPYIEHPTGVAKIAKAYGGTDEEMAAAYLHDIVEDAGAKLDDIEEKFGPNIATIVGDVTNDPYGVRRLGKEEYINQELQTIPDSSLFVKLCDIYYNLLDYPTQDQKDRMIRNVSVLLNSERGDRLDDKCLDLIDACIEVA